MNTSIFLAKALGLYYVFISLAFIINKKTLKPAIFDMINNMTIMIFSSFITLIIGILLIVSHNIWVEDWRLIITLIGWLALTKGLILMLFPDFLGALSRRWIENTTAYYGTFIFTLLLGLVLLYFGYFLKLPKIVF